MVVLELDRWNVIRILFRSLDIVKTSANYLLALYVPEQMKKGLDLTFKGEKKTLLRNTWEAK